MAILAHPSKLRAFIQKIVFCIIYKITDFFVFLKTIQKLIKIVKLSESDLSKFNRKNAAQS